MPYRYCPEPEEKSCSHKNDEIVHVKQEYDRETTGYWADDRDEGIGWKTDTVDRPIVKLTWRCPDCGRETESTRSGYARDYKRY